MPYIKQVLPMDGYRLLLEMQTGSTVLVEIRRQLDTARFGDLNDEDFFRTATTDGDYVIWNDGRYALRVSARELLDVAMNDRQAYPGQRGYGLATDDPRP